jgi:hypothetical protein
MVDNAGKSWEGNCDNAFIFKYPFRNTVQWAGRRFRRRYQVLEGVRQDGRYIERLGPFMNVKLLHSAWTQCTKGCSYRFDFVVEVPGKLIS